MWGTEQVGRAGWEKMGSEAFIRVSSVQQPLISSWSTGWSAGRHICEQRHTGRGAEQIIRLMRLWQIDGFISGCWNTLCTDTTQAIWLLYILCSNIWLHNSNLLCRRYLKIKPVCWFLPRCTYPKKSKSMAENLAWIRDQRPQKKWDA